jgi:hypothetical protein
MTVTSVNLNYRPMQQHTYLTTTGPTSVFTVTQKGGYLTALHFVNDDGSAATMNIDFYDGSSTFPLYDDQSVNGNHHLSLDLPAPFFVKSGQEIRITANHANRVHVWAFGIIID